MTGQQRPSLDNTKNYDDFASLVQKLQNSPLKNSVKVTAGVVWFDHHVATNFYRVVHVTFLRRDAGLLTKRFADCMHSLS